MFVRAPTYRVLFCFVLNGYCWRSLILLQGTLRTNKSICTYAENPILLGAVCIITPRGRNHDLSLFVFYRLRFVLAVHIIIIQAFGAGLRTCLSTHDTFTAAPGFYLG